MRSLFPSLFSRPGWATRGAQDVGRRFHGVVEQAESELHAAALGLPIGRHGPSRFRKWLGWSLYRLAAWINPEVTET